MILFYKKKERCYKWHSGKKKKSCHILHNIRKTNTTELQ
nr:MAG TPA: hypothetical protein [Bacteriophage sp.]